MRKLLFLIFNCSFLITLATPAFADWGIIDSLNLAPFVPMVLDALMTVATGGYEFFVGNGNGIIYILVWGFLAVSVVMYLIKMYFPKDWVAFFGFSGGGEFFSDKTPTGFQIAENVLKPALRAIIAATLLLQVKPIYVTEWIVDPFLRFGALYTHSITETIPDNINTAKKIECPADVIAKGWISQDACNFLVQPVSDLSNANNQIIKRGFEFMGTGLAGVMTLSSGVGMGFLNIITGILLVSTFVGSNIFMALLIIGAIFGFGMSLVLYPFQVLTWVAKPRNPNSWLDLWPAFDGIIKALQQLIVTMIACAFILTINVAIIRALFQWNGSMNIGAGGFGEHSILWLSSILTFYLMLRIFTLTREQLEKYVGKDVSGLYNNVKSDSKSLVGNIQKTTKGIAKAVGWIKKK